MIRVFFFFEVEGRAEFSICNNKFANNSDLYRVGWDRDPKSVIS